jgi:hypothetical protein
MKHAESKIFDYNVGENKVIRGVMQGWVGAFKGTLFCAINKITFGGVKVNTFLLLELQADRLRFARNDGVTGFCNNPKIRLNGRFELKKGSRFRGSPVNFYLDFILILAAIRRI